ncbi:hypothetical protein M513_03245, partial [Trichuris suis]
GRPFPLNDLLQSIAVWQLPLNFSPKSIVYHSAKTLWSWNNRICRTYTCIHRGKAFHGCVQT